MKESDVIISDLLVGYYFNDGIVKWYVVLSFKEYIYVYYLLME